MRISCFVGDVAAAGAVGDVEDVVGEHGDIGGFAVEDLFQLDGDFVAAAGTAFGAVDVSHLTGVGEQALG
jgi:hypothetical protein